jgi:hypothetical protein
MKGINTASLQITAKVFLNIMAVIFSNEMQGRNEA